MKVRLIYLAAGNSRRFGSNKLLYWLEGKPLFLHLLERLVRICGRHGEWELVLVTQYPEVCEEAVRLGVRAVWSPESREGISYSIRAGLLASGEAESLGEPEACVFFTADQPYLAEESAEGFLEAMEKGQAGLGYVAYGERRGNPVWFSRKYFQELAELTGDQGGRQVLRAHMEEAVCFSVAAERELEDMDTPAACLMHSPAEDENL